MKENEKRMYVVQNCYGYFWCGLKQWSKQLRKAQVFTSMRYAKDVIRTAEYGCRILEISMSIIGEVDA